jgi:uncharacterized protein (TIGR02246 family)
MRNKAWLGLLGGVLATLAVVVIVARESQPAPAGPPGAASAPGDPGAEKARGKEAGEDNAEKADREALRKSAQEFVRAFARGDAKAVASFWAEKGEYYDDTGAAIRGRAAIEKAYAELFKAHPKITVEIETRSVHFPAPDTAVADGVLRFKTPGAGLATSTRYSALHVRRGGGWKVAIAREWGANEDKLEDVAWLVGNWAARPKGREVQVSFQWNDTRTLIRGRFSVKEEGVVTSSGTQTIGMDPQTGFLHSWVFDDEGGRGQAVWARDGNRWVQDAAGVLSDGTEYTAVNIITPLNDDEFVWRSTDRTVGDSEAPDTDPLKLRRVTAGK